MPDKSLVISSFRYGLDTRRESLASLPGTLQTLQNAFINSGGEIEKRRAFVYLGTIPNGASGAPASGFQDTDSGIMVFSSDPNPGGLPTNVVWQQLTYPYGLSPSGNLNIVFASTGFQGKAFVVVGFTGSPGLVYFNGSIVNQITDGVVLSDGLVVPETLSDLSKDLARIVGNISGWMAHSNVTAGPPSLVPGVGYNESALIGSTLIMTPVGVHMTPVVQNNNSVAGLLGVKLLDQNYPGIGAVAASAAFSLNAGTSGTVDVQAPSKSDGTNVISITNGTVNFNTNLTQTAIDIVTAINNFTYVSGYSAATTVAGVVTVYAPTSFGAITFNLTVITTGTITTTGATPGKVFSLTLTPPSLNAVVTVPGSASPQSVSGVVYASATGNVGDVTYTWTELTPHNSTPPFTYGDVFWSAGNNVYGPVNSPITGPACGFAVDLAPGTSVTRLFQCSAYDGTSTVTKQFTVKLSLNH